MPRVKRGTKRRAKRKKILDRASGYFLTKSKLYVPPRSRCSAALKFAFCRPPPEEAPVPLHLDRAHQRRRQAERHQLQPVHQRPEEGGIELDRKVLADIAVNDAPAFAKLASRPRPRTPHRSERKESSHGFTRISTDFDEI